jgi:hypothetical protein
MFTHISRFKAANPPPAAALSTLCQLIIPCVEHSPS